MSTSLQFPKILLGAVSKNWKVIDMRSPNTTIRKIIQANCVKIKCSSFFSLEIHRKKGVVLERWDGIDGYLIEKLLEDPRFPRLPTYVSYTPKFSEPVNWGDNYGSRIRGYFVPKKSGQHVFYIGEKRRHE